MNVEAPSTFWIGLDDTDEREHGCTTYDFNDLLNTLMKSEIQSDWGEDIVHLFNSSKVFLYDSTEHWSSAGVTEGFGLPPVVIT